MTLDPLAAIKVTFFQECEEQLAELESGLLAMQDGTGDGETVNAVFRAVHSIKGGAGAFAIDGLVRFAHVFETVLDDVRSGTLAATASVVKTMLRAADMLADHVRAARDGGDIDEAQSEALIAALSALGSAGAGHPAQGSEPSPALPGNSENLEGIDFKPLAFEFNEIEAPAAPSGNRFVIKFRPLTVLYANANEPRLLLRELDRLGTIEKQLHLGDLPPLQDLNPEESYLSWTLTLVTEREEAAIREVFEWVEGDCELEVTRAEGTAPSSPAPDAPALRLVADNPTPAAAATAAEALPAGMSENFDVLAILQKAGAAIPAEVEAPPANAAATVDALPHDPTGVVVALNQPAAPTADKQRAEARAEAAAKNSDVAAGQSIRVDLDRVDRLIDLVGELVINQSMLAQRVSECGIARASSVAVGLDELEQLTREIQDSVMAIRAQPVKSVFQRMPRLVREVASLTGKSVHLVTDGENTEVDKTVIEKISDPLTHMIRNAIDHGIEKPEDRIAAGKPAEGQVRLSALHRSGRIVIEVTDDGRGINRPRVREIAVQKGLIAPDAQLTDDETDNLIFMPGFSTASNISNISGRGVGMDVVRRSVQALGGRIAIASRPGEGSTFTLSLPLTLAVLDGMVLSVCDQTLIIPLTAIVESMQPKAKDVRTIGPNVKLIAIRDAYVPLVDIGHVLGYRPEPLEPTAGVAVLVEGEDGTSAALLVDAILGQRQVVIKSLEANYRQVPGIAAATILGNGRVALILDVDAIVARRRDGGFSEPQRAAG